MKKCFMLFAGVIISLLTLGCNTSNQMVTEVKSSDFYEVNFLSLSKTTQYFMDLKKNSNIKFGLDKESGKVSVKVLDSDGKLIYLGKKKNENIIFEVLKSGVYNFIVETKNATGTVFFKAF